MQDDLRVAGTVTGYVKQEYSEDVKKTRPKEHVREMRGIPVWPTNGKI